MRTMKKTIKLIILLCCVLISLSVGVTTFTESDIMPFKTTLNNGTITTLSTEQMPLKANYETSIASYKQLTVQHNIPTIHNLDDLYKQIGWSVSMFESSLTLYTDFQVKSTDMSFPRIAEYSRDVDQFTGSLLHSMKYNITVIGGEYKIDFSFNYYISKDQYYDLLDFTEEFVNGMVGWSDYEKVKHTHDYLINNCDYDINMDGPYNCIFNKRSNCNGYALAFCLIMRECDIECKYITGLNHAWNAVKLGSFWYNIDDTWDDTGSGISYDYFLKGRGDWTKHDSKEATAAYQYSRSEFSNWIGTIFYYGRWVVLLVGVPLVIMFIKRKLNTKYY